ncbi:MAG TPA: hypothetical protein VFK61_03775 [Candidatus Limnocylindria bacterium]|nr:hypothetical protein [Candidatus Limnocylindria bacterium]
MRTIGLLLAALLLAGCSLLVNDPPVVPDNASPAVWHIDGEQPSGDATAFVAQVTERACASGRDIRDLLLPPVIDYGDEAIIVSLYLQPLGGGAQSCVGTLPTPFTIELAEPIGDRMLVDGIGGDDDDPG